MNKKQNNTKRNRKILLLSSLLLVGVVGGSIGGTYAWFVANRTATGSVTNISTAAIGNLEVKLSSASDYGSTYSYSTRTELTDVSGNGVTMFKPVIRVGSSNDAGGSVTFSAINQVTTNPGTDGSVYYIDTTLDFRSERPLAIYLKDDSAISATAGDNLFHAVRVAFFEGTAATGTVKAYFHNSADTTLNYLTSNAVDASGNPTGIGVLTGGNVLKEGFTDHSASTYVSTYADTLVVLGSLANGYYTGSVTFRIWLEGTDSNCVEDNIPNINMTAALNFYGLDTVAI